VVALDLPGFGEARGGAGAVGHSFAALTHLSVSRSVLLAR
jgi:hypothetical protein